MNWPDWLIGECPRWQELPFWIRHGVGLAVGGTVLVVLVGLELCRKNVCAVCGKRARFRLEDDICCGKVECRERLLEWRRAASEQLRMKDQE